MSSYIAFTWASQWVVTASWPEAIRWSKDTKVLSVRWRGDTYGSRGNHGKSNRKVLQWSFVATNDNGNHKVSRSGRVDLSLARSAKTRASRRRRWSWWPQKWTSWRAWVIRGILHDAYPVRVQILVSGERMCWWPLWKTRSISQCQGPPFGAKPVRSRPGLLIQHSWSWKKCDIMWRSQMNHRNSPRFLWDFHEFFTLFHAFFMAGSSGSHMPSCLKALPFCCTAVRTTWYSYRLSNFACFDTAKQHRQWMRMAFCILFPCRISWF